VARLNWGCGDAGEPGWINSDLKTGPRIDITSDIREGLPVANDTFDYIVSVHALPMISYPDLVPVLEELRRVLRPGGTLRLVLPDLNKGIDAYLQGNESHFVVPDSEVTSIGGKFVVHMLWYGWSVTMFTPDFAFELLTKAGYRCVEHCEPRQTRSSYSDIVDLDNRESESLYIEGVK
jgi:SAM-dependent methyltransferase